MSRNQFREIALLFEEGMATSFSLQVQIVLVYSYGYFFLLFSFFQAQINFHMHCCIKATTNNKSLQDVDMGRNTEIFPELI